MNDSSREPLYVGTFRHALDAKNRVTVPARWRFEGDELDSYLAWPQRGPCITVFPPSKIAEVRRKAARVATSDSQAQAALRQLFGKGHLFGCDKAGRIKLPEPLLRHAGISREAVLMGLSDHFAVYSPEVHNSLEEENFDLNAALAAIGI